MGQGMEKGEVTGGSLSGAGWGATDGAVVPRSQRAAIVQGDRSVLLEVEHADHDRCRDLLIRFAEIEKSPEHVHTYVISDLSLWNAAATGATADEVVAAIDAISRFEVPSHVIHEVRDRMARHGVCSLHDVPGDASVLELRVKESLIASRLGAEGKINGMLVPAGEASFRIAARDRGRIKQGLLRLGWPVDDRAGLIEGAPLALEAQSFTPYPYQEESVRRFVGAGGHGVVVLPCGAGKTVVALLGIAKLQTRALVLTTSREACTQWRRELLGKSSLGERQVGIYDTGRKEVAPITITTYSMMSRKGGDGPTGHVHFDRLAAEPWGLVVYDEVHLLPAPVFRLTAELQARRRLGLTATLVREDGRQGDVFSLIGPKRYDVPWRELEKSGHIAAATCFEVRVPLDPSLHDAYASSPLREQPRIAADNPNKLRALGAIADRHLGDRLLVLGTYLESLAAAGKILGATVITGETPHAEREKAYAAFRRGETRRLVLSRVGNFAIDLPEANVLIQLSGTMGSRQEEAQRLGRVLRPKPGGATFYTLVTRDTVEQEHALHRQLFLTEQGYRYYIEDWKPELGGDDGVVVH